MQDIDPGETREWLEALEQVTTHRGPERAGYLVTRLQAAGGHPAASGQGATGPGTTPYVNTIPTHQEPPMPGDLHLQRRLRAYLRWNAVVMVLRANAAAGGLGGHLATYASAAALYETGFNYFFRGRDAGPGDQVFYQGHAAPGIYARAYLEGRIGEDRMDGFRREVDGAGLSSYPHPRLMPDFWEFPTVSMGLGAINAVYQARFNRYLHARGLADTSASRVWCFLGDGECDEPESLAGLALAAREGLDNLTFVVNCNLQRLDGPVRGNGKVVQELEGLFRGAGWHVLKVLWGADWDPLLADDAAAGGQLAARLASTPDGEFQRCAVEPGATREVLFGPEPELAALAAHLSDEDLEGLRRGGHDDAKLYAAFDRACRLTGAPTVILAKTVKGWALGPEVAGRNAAHQIKTMGIAQLKALRDRLGLSAEIPDAALDDGQPPYCRPAADSPEHAFLLARRRALGGSMPRRRPGAGQAGQPDPACFGRFLEGSDRPASTTMAFAGLLRSLLRDPTIGRRVVPIVPDEARTFGLDGLFSEVRIYTPGGQRYQPVDGGMQLAYREAEDGQLLQEGITEAGAMASFTAAGTAYATWGQPMIPFYVFYSMFGFQRTGDAMWAFGDMRGRGFLCGATAGRTTLNGEGLQHQDGHSLLLASTVPNLAAYDPAFAYELAVIVRDGLARMYGDAPEDVFYYVTLYNEPYPMPAMPRGAEEGIVRGIYRFSPAPEGPRRAATILFSGSAQGAAREAQELLARDHDVAAELWSVTSYKALREDALAAERWNRLHPTGPARSAWVTEQLLASQGPLVAVTDFLATVPDQIARWVPGHLTVLGTDGYGRSDTRARLRRHFGTDAAHLVVAVLKGLADADAAKPEEVADAIAAYGIDPDTVEPRCA